MMWGSKLSAVLSALSLTHSAAPATELEQIATESNIRQVAIIGAGAGGSSTAYYLQKFAEAEGVPVNITVFEKTDRIGGRTLTVEAYNNPLEPVELGASIFIEANHIMYNASLNFGLPLKEPESGSDGFLGIWDGEKFVFTQDDSSWEWWNLAKLFWKYGTAPYKAQKLVQSTVSTFLQLYEKPHFPFRSLTQRVFELDLLKATSVTGEQFLVNNDIGELFAHDIIQAATRVNYASNLRHIHGLETMVSLAPEGAKQVIGGNWQIFATMLDRSNATVQRNTSVTSIALKSGSTDSKYLLSTKGAHSEVDANAADQYPIAFDNVVIATPWQYGDISVSEDLFQHKIDEIPYTKLHVTLFASPFRISPKYFGLAAGSKAPDTVLTTLNPDDDSKAGSEGAGKAGFYSISTLRTVTNPDTLKDEFIYKIFSPGKVTADFLSELLGVEVPESIIPAQKIKESSPRVVDPISWYHPHVFNSYPIEYPRVTFQDPILRDGLYYLSGIESFISCMETSSLMGMNIARLIADDLSEANTHGRIETDDAQEILGQAVKGAPVADEL
ncbi:Prenylcysteine oxidase [Colletotrichum higginsianum IMI 349063]|uniref:Prenylcysteine oxidase n=3 Tax=Colletotrichum higginsianum TaxID=80884 RepID=A0A1B7YW07_COLHI|nr:Prenylcysteine oxidase [Colletotrichum higginsianum IMI 349063]OBR16213.1 Prenylcysteine oxidase [Colletotrichum higginsianum IMI 349063]